MRITKLSAVNFKGQTFEHELAPVTLFCGPNSTGKSAREQSLKLALAGYLPGLPKKHNEIFELLSSSNPMSVETVSNNGLSTSHICSRKWEKERGSVKHTSFGVSMPPVTIDAAEYLSLSDAERVKFLFSVAQLPDCYKGESLALSIIASIKNIKCEENTEATEVAIRDTAEYVSGFEPTLLKQSAQEWITALATSLREQKLTAEASVKRLAQTSQGLTQIAGDTTPAPNNAEALLHNAKEFLKRAQEIHTTLNTRLEKCREEYREANTTANLTSELPKFHKMLKALEDQKQKMKRVAKPEPQEPLIKAEQEAREIKLRKDGLVATVTAAVQSLEEHIEKAAHARVCPTCGQSVKGEKKSIIAALNKDLRAQKRGLIKDKEEAKKATATWQAAKDALDLWVGRNEAFSNYLQTLRQIESDISNCSLAIAKCGDASAAATKVEALRKIGIELAQQFETAKTMLAEKQIEVEDRERDYRRLLAERAEAQSRSRAVAVAAETRVEAEVLKAAYAILGTLQAELVASAVGPLIGTCNKLCGDILKAPLSYRDGEIGMLHPETGKFITHHSMSDSEQLLTYAAVSIALASKAPLKLAIIGKLEAFDDENKIRLAAKLISLVESKDIDQAVLVCVGRPPKFNSFNHGDTFKLIEIEK